MLILDLRVLRFGKSLFVAVKRERSQLYISVLLRQRVFAFHREIRRSDLGAGHGEVRSLLAV